MTEDTLESKPPNPQMSRRGFLAAVGTFFGKTVLEEIPHLEPHRKTIEEMVAEVEAMSLEELEIALYEHPVVPDIEPIADRINAIADIPEGSNLMKVGSSVGKYMLESIYSREIKKADIDFGSEQYKLEEVLKYFRMPPQTLDALTVGGADADSLLHEPMFCRGPMPCPPNTSVIDAYIDHYEPKVSINFIGTNMVRENVTLEDFAGSTVRLIDHYISKGVIPVLTTFPQPRNSHEEPYNSWFNEPTLTGNRGQTPEEESQEEIEYRSTMLPENARKYNVLLLKIAEAYQIPIINLERGVKETAKDHGNRMPNETQPDIDPNHFSTSIETVPLKVPENGEEFRDGEHAVSYFTIQTLYGILAHQPG